MTKRPPGRLKVRDAESINRAASLAWARRRAAIIAYWTKHGTPATRERYGISRQRIAQILEQGGA